MKTEPAESTLGSETEPAESTLGSETEPAESTLGSETEPAELAAQLDAVHTRFGFDVGPVRGAEWFPFAELPAHVGGWVAELTGEGRAPSEVAMSLLSGLTGPVIRPLAVAAVLFGRVPVVTPGTVSVRRRGRITDRAALTCPVASDVDMAALLVELCGPVVEELYRTTRFGRRNLWGGLGDTLSSHTLWAGRHRGDRPAELHALFAGVQSTLDRVSAAVDVRFPRPVPFPLSAADKETVAQVRGTCCLHYRIPGRTHPDGTPRFCGSCPLIDDDARRVRMRPLVDAGTTTARTAHLGMPTA
ncbi:(2Fe-2S)-binding protein [Pseudonocardia pini]|uniref:(2Fe-2S)-binding protein n=1 Tax=Pseudonocardia pini TaxID=2758030 RepID=UPI0015F03674|nr:(2Fe-2S)-binding protein [Pseudonocardia pini]